MLFVCGLLNEETSFMLLEVSLQSERGDEEPTPLSDVSDFADADRLIESFIKC